MSVTSETGARRRARRWEPRVDARKGERYIAVALKGAALKQDAILNKGTNLIEPHSLVRPSRLVEICVCDPEQYEQ